MWHPAPAGTFGAGSGVPLQENERPVGCATALNPPAAGSDVIKDAAKAAVGAQRARSASGAASAREFGTIVDGGSAAGGLAGGAPPQGRRSPGRNLGLDQRRKRPADAAVYVDEEFRDEQPHGRLALRATAGASAPPTASDAARRLSLAGSGPGQGDRAARPRSREPHGQDDESMSEAHEAGDKENWLGMPRGSLGAAAPDHDRALRELAPGLPEDPDHAFSDVESSSGDEDFESENLAEQLAERVRLNADGRYDFEVYVDP